MLTLAPTSGSGALAELEIERLAASVGADIIEYEPTGGPALGYSLPGGLLFPAGQDPAQRLAIAQHLVQRQVTA